MPEFTERVPSFDEHVNEAGNLPTGAQHDSAAPWNQTDLPEWRISHAEYDEANGDIVFTISGEGYPETVRLWSGDQNVIDAINPGHELDGQEYDAAILRIVSAINDDKPNEFPDSIHEIVSNLLEAAYEKPQREDNQEESNG